MAYTSQLKTTVDLPIWEWLRFAQTTSTAISGTTTAGQGDHRYIYYLVSNAFARYDTYSDTWQLLSSPNTAQSALTPVGTVCLKYNSQVGYYGRVLSAGASTFTCAALVGQMLKGYTVRIISGTGAGQERVISSVADPVIVDTFVVTTAGIFTQVDSSKSWKANQWVGYQMRMMVGAGAGQVRKIIYNTGTVLTVADGNHFAISPWTWGAPLGVTTNIGTLGVIESSVVTVSSPWTIQPDATSEFMVLSGGIFMSSATGAVAASFLYYYDILADIWYQKMVPTGFFGTSVQAGPADVIETLSEANQNYLTGTATAGAASTLTDSGQALSLNRYAGYAIKITGGTGIGQMRTIIANTATVFYVNRPWGTNPDNTSAYSVISDYDKLLSLGNTWGNLAYYSCELDMWSASTFYDYGVARPMSAAKAGWEPLGVITITRLTGGILTVNATPTVAGTGYKVNDVLTCSTGGTSGRVRVTSVDSVGGVTAIALENPGSGYTTGTGKAVTGGTGASCTINIASIGDMATVTTGLAHVFSIGDSVTIAGATQSDYNGAKTILGADTNTTFAYAVSNTPVTPATFTALTTTLLVDVTKNWTVNEFVGKCLLTTQAFLAAQGGTSNFVKITSNTATTITLSTVIPLYASGTAKYAIVDLKLFGTDTLQPSSPGDGIATAGAASTLTDSTKSWITNIWASRKLRIIAGTGVGQEVTIVSNTATIITISGSWATNPDATSVYSVEDSYGVSTATATTTITDTTQNWPASYYQNKKVRFFGATSGTEEVTMTTNTATVLTFTAVTAAPTIGTPYAVMAIPSRGLSTRLIHAFNQTDASNKGRYIYSFRGGATSIVDRYNISTQRWDYLLLVPNGETLTTGTMYAYDGQDRIYFTRDATGRVFCLDLTTNRVDGCGLVPYGMGTAIVGNRMDITKSVDGIKYLYIMRHSGTEYWRTLLWI